MYENPDENKQIHAKFSHLFKISRINAWKNTPFPFISRIRTFLWKYPFFAKMDTRMGVRFGLEWGRVDVGVLTAAVIGCALRSPERTVRDIIAWYRGTHDSVRGMHQTTSYHMMTSWKHFPRYWSFVVEFTGDRWIPRTKASDAGLWCFLWSGPWINDWVNNRGAGDLRRHRAHYDVIVMNSVRPNTLVSLIP